MKINAGKSKAKKLSKERFHITAFINPSGETVYRVGGYKPNGERVRVNCQTETEALSRKADLYIEAANIVTTTATRMKATRLSDDEVKDAERALPMLQEKFKGKTLVNVVEYFLANYREPVRQLLVADAVKQFLADREKQNRRPDTLRNLRGRLGMFTRLYGEKNVSGITTDDCREFVFRSGTSPRNQINDRLAVSNFLNWCLRRQFAAINAMEPVDKPAVDTEEPSVLSLNDCRNLLAAAREYKEGLLLPYVAISLFGGLRPTEISRITWDRIDLKDGTITLDGSMAKTRQRRIVKLPANAIAWLLPLAPQRPEFQPAAFARHFGRVKHAAGFNGKDAKKAAAAAAAAAGKAPTGDKPKLRPWVQDYMRHTAISMYLAKHKHEGEAASWAGNSPNVIHRHYKGLVKETEAEEYWSITPEAVQGVIIKLPAQAAA
jgi:integrase